MGRKILVLLLCLVSALYLTNCTSKGSDGATEEAPETQEEDANGDPIDNPDGAVSENAGEETTDGMVADVPPVETKPASETPPDVTPTDKPMDTSVAVTNETPPPMMDNSLSTSSTMAEPPAPKVTKPAAPYQKVAAAPFNSGKKVMNSVYVARKGDTWNKVANKVFNAKTAAKDLKKWNGSLSHRELKVGDKVYYNSPNRPEDSSKLLTYFEDKGDIPQTYVAKEGDNLKKVAKELLGSEESWKELWATNTFESKGALGAGTEIKYWMASVEEPPPQTVAKAEPVAPPPPMNETPPPPQPPVNNVPPPVNNVAPPPEDPQPPVAANNEPPQPPVNNVPPPPQQAPPPQPPQVAENDPAATEEIPAEGEAGEDDQLLYIGGGIGAVLLIVIAMIIRRRKAAQEMDDQAFDEKTHVG
jgi:hypothetical protein